MQFAAVPVGDAALYAQCMFLSQPMEGNGVGAGFVRRVGWGKRTLPPLLCCLPRYTDAEGI